VTLKRQKNWTNRYYGVSLLSETLLTLKHAMLVGLKGQNRQTNVRKSRKWRVKACVIYCSVFKLLH